MADAIAQLPIPRMLLGMLVLVLAAVAAPHAANLAPGVLGFFYLCLLWRLLSLGRPGLLPGRGILLLLLMLALLLVVETTGISDGRRTGTALLLVMLGLKLLETRVRRDMHITVFLGFFLILTVFLYDQTLGLALYLTPGAAVLTGVQLGLSRLSADSLGLLRSGSLLLLGALPLALVLFVGFPRLATPLWSVATPSASTGISNDMTVGDIGRLSQSTAVAFRVEFLDTVPKPEQRYWRGPVLWHTDGRRWTGGARTSSFDGDVVGEISIDYEITLEPSGEFWMFGLDYVASAPKGARVHGDLSLIAEQAVRRRLVYRAQSFADFRPDSLSALDRERGLQLAGVSQRVQDLVAQWQREVDPTDATRMVDRALRYFREEPFVYTLEPGVLRYDAVDSFLFETRRGFCEHYAASFTTLMRLAGIPTRIVIGYQGGERNPRADHWVIRQSDAHAWTEVWISDEGWVRVDPTAAVAPERIRNSINAALSQHAERVIFSGREVNWINGLIREIQWMGDAMDLNWHRYVVGYSSQRQNNLLDRLGLGGLKGYGLVIVMLTGALVAALAVLAVSRLWRRRERLDPLPRLWRRLVRKLHAAGVTTAPSQGPDTLCSTAAAQYPKAAGELAAIARLYVQLRYGRAGDSRQFQALRRRIRALHLRH